MNLYQFNGNNPALYTDPFGLCTPPDSPACQLITGVADGTRGLTHLEPVMLAVASLPTFGAAGGISGEALSIGNALRTSTSGLLRAGGVADRVASAVGGTMSALEKSDGFKVTVEAAKSIVAGIKATGEMRVSIDQVGSLTREGVVSSQRALTHLKNLTKSVSSLNSDTLFL